MLDLWLGGHRGRRSVSGSAQSLQLRLTTYCCNSAQSALCRRDQRGAALSGSAAAVQQEVQPAGGLPGLHLLLDDLCWIPGGRNRLLPGRRAAPPLGLLLLLQALHPAAVRHPAGRQWRPFSLRGVICVEARGRHQLGYRLRC